jgi:Icc-related predicted phosphoesterase
MSFKPLRIAATADLHYSKTSHGQHRELFEHASDAADVLLLCGDLTDYGTVEEAQVLCDDFRKYARIPTLAVLGNHDLESNQQHELRATVEAAGVRVLDGECAEIDGVGFAGICGFGGGFGQWMLNAWGEPTIKQFVQEAIDQAVRLEQALARLHTEQRVVLLHYSPLRETVEGEPAEIWPFLGSTRLEGPLNRFHVNATFHGHAHNGRPEGHTTGNVPVFNVAVPVLAKTPDAFPHRFRLFELNR